MCDDDEEGITQFQRDAFEALLQGWNEIQHKISDAILEYYNNEEKVRMVRMMSKNLNHGGLT